MRGRFVPQSNRDKLNCNSVAILLIEFFMNNIQQLVIDKVKALSLNQQKTVLYFIDQLLTPNAILIYASLTRVICKHELH
jgi:hypothetical protein